MDILPLLTAIIVPVTGVCLAVLKFLDWRRETRKEGYDLIERGVRLLSSKEPAERLAGAALLERAMKIDASAPAASAALALVIRSDPELANLPEFKLLISYAQDPKISE